MQKVSFGAIKNYLLRCRNVFSTLKLGGGFHQFSNFPPKRIFLFIFFSRRDESESLKWKCEIGSSSTVFFRVLAKTGIMSLTWDPCWDKLKKNLLVFAKQSSLKGLYSGPMLGQIHCQSLKLRLKPIPAVPLSSRVGLQSLGNSKSILLKLSNWCLCFQQLI